MIRRLLALVRLARTPPRARPVETATRQRRELAVLRPRRAESR